ncbi:P-type conjugative transfer protein TrbG [Azospirillum sp. CT11-132]|uniref:P-type conjugative transfer protein TrbG n=1 Tax=Azospirillum sp. CT11-132 TaxID=3396317 RepID=UPI0039A41A55
MLKVTLTLAALAVTGAGPTLAQQVPAIQTVQTEAPGAALPAGDPPAVLTRRTGTPPPVNLMSGKEAELNAKEKRGVALSGEWRGGKDRPARGQAGRVTFTYGSTLPSVVCAPLRVCNLELQPGEVVQQIDLGDIARWKATPTAYGTGANQTSVIVIKASDSGLTTTMTIATDRRIYVVQLVSRTKDWMPLVAFVYPEDVQQDWDAYRAAVNRRQQATTLSDGLNAANLDFNFAIRGDSPSWRPVRVYTDGRKTYIQFPSEMRYDESPALVAIGADDKEQLVNYRASGDRYVVDKVLRHAALISGVGDDQTKVEILRKRN